MSKEIADRKMKDHINGEKEKENRESGGKLLDAGIFLVCLLIYGGLMFLNFRQQAIGLVESDMEAYIQEMLGTNTKYAFPYPVYFRLGALIHLVVSSSRYSMAIAAVLLCLGSAAALKYYVDQDIRVAVGETGRQADWRHGLLGTAAALSLLLVSMLYVPTGYRFQGIPFAYVGVFSPNPFHNATYNAARPFAIVSFFLFGAILSEYETRADWKKYIGFSLSLLLATLTKPSFTLVLVSTAGLIMLWRLIRSKGKGFVAALKLGVTFIPTFAVLLYQFVGVFGPVEQEGGIGFGFLTVWRHYCDNVPLALLLAAAFPLTVLLCHLKELSARGLLRFSWQFYLAGLAEFVFLYEKGFRLVDANFSWGYMYGLFFVFACSLLVLIKDSLQRRGRLWARLLQWAMYGLHLLLGVYYLYGILSGASYY